MSCKSCGDPNSFKPSLYPEDVCVYCYKSLISTLERRLKSILSRYPNC